ncbi:MULTISPECIES: hypothetical protein [Mycolicibacter]|uniref:DUF4832 domain-containing protein n=1 Tax=[Mycobacterium] vasticus TaxID=2875777 RepID=A0ABU5YRQ5_9MYCO|nr:MULTISPECIES: hypothetical protein [unclassified Mycolicibacter]MEB3061526.1 hypothetical protein [Mycolicibacter sp. MYC101]MEB3067795.1 hypothetical protein [Mycolicibacter sp. MYC017]
MIRKLTGLVLGCSLLFASAGCGGAGSGEIFRAVISPPIPAGAQELSNPARGQYEDLMVTLFPQGNPAQKRYQDWPKSYDASLRIAWRDLQPVDPRTLPHDATDDQKYDFRIIDDTLAQLATRHMRMTLRVYAYNSCCNAHYPNDTNAASPDWLRTLPGTTTSHPGPSGTSGPAITHVVPNWNDSGYLDHFTELLAALGRRYDHDERLSVFEFSGYGDFSENHNAYLRDALGVPGPGPYESPDALGYVSQFKDQNITKASIERLVKANVDAFPHTQLVVTPNNPEIVRELLDDGVTRRLSAPVGIRSDCLGVYAPLPVWAESSKSYYVTSKDPVIDKLERRMLTAPVITEWCELPEGTDAADYYRKGLRDIVRYHVSMTSSVNFADRNSDQPMKPELYLLWADANVAAGYRYSVAGQAKSESLRDGTAKITVNWTNYGSAATTERWAPSYRLIDFSGTVVRTIDSAVDLHELVHDGGPGAAAEQPVPASVKEPVQLDVADLPPGHYTLQGAVTWQQHKPDASHVVDYPPMHLARDGRDAQGWYPIATLDIPRSALTAAPQR